jgi:ubiquinone/menaquinone biosynthesis C-methylase UbiE
MEETATQTTRKTYDGIAEQYSGSVDETTAGWVGEFEQGLLDLFVGMLPGITVLDLGCGNGKDARSLELKSLKVTGADFSRGMLNVAGKRNTSIPFVQTDMRRLGFGAEKFSGIWANGCVYHVPKADFPDVLSETRRVLKKGGIFSYNFKVGEGEGMEEKPRSFGGGPRYYAYYGVEEMMALLEQAGWEFLTGLGYPKKIFGETIAHFWVQKI